MSACIYRELNDSNYNMLPSKNDRVKIVMVEISKSIKWIPLVKKIYRDESYYEWEIEISVQPGA